MVKVTKEYCKQCNLCIKLCPFNNMEMKDNIPVLKDPEKCNVFQIFKLFLDENEQKELADRYKNGGLGYGDAKKMLLERILDYFGPYRKKRVELEGNLDYINSVINSGNEKANQRALKTLEEVKKAVGLI